MSVILISNEESELLEKRGFFIRNTSVFIEFLKSIVSITMLVYFLGGIGYVLPVSNTGITYSIVGLLLWLYIIISFYYVTSSKVYYIKDGIVGFGMRTKQDIINSKAEEISFAWNYLSQILEKITFKENNRKDNNKKGLIYTMYGVALVGNFQFFGYFGLYQLLSNTNFLVTFFAPIILIFLFIITYSCFAYLINKLINTFHPLYAFGNIGEKIQKLTPKIEEQSKKIQSEFRADMNFSILNNGFDSLSATFSEIVSLVIKLEKVETRVNKGNLFDSEKYINSVRTDIMEPLRSLRGFLEEQKNKLINSQKVPIRVQVGGSTSTGNTELQSKRSESLIVELKENIEKLDTMIEKIGEI